MDFLNELVPQITEQFERIGLYGRDIQVMIHLGSETNPDPVENRRLVDERIEAEGAENLIRSGDLRCRIVCLFEVGSVALSERVLDPEGFAERQKFQEIVPSSTEMLREAAAAAAAEMDLDNWEDDEDD